MVHGTLEEHAETDIPTKGAPEKVKRRERE